MKRELRRGLVLSCVLAAAAACGSDQVGTTSQAATISTDLVISQVYGGGGNGGAPYLNDYVELVNIGATTLQMSQYSVQYASATGLFSSTSASLYVDLPSFSLAPGQYFLVQLSGGTNGVALPTPDATGTISMSATNGKVALTMQNAKLDACGNATTPCNAANWVDLVGYGSADEYEGTGAAPVMSNTTADFRKACTDTGDNAADFTNAAPVPHDSQSPFVSCAADAGTDASDGGIILVDGGAADGGTVDGGGVDGGAADGGTVDGGGVDGGVVDGGATDAGAMDGGVTDAGVTDAGVTDGGKSEGGLSFDSGTVDSGAKDSGTKKDASADAGYGSGSSSGCSCDVRGGSRTPAWTGLGWALGLAALVQSRRRRARDARDAD